MNCVKYCVCLFIRRTNCRERVLYWIYFEKRSQVLTELNFRAVGSFDLPWDVLRLSVLSHFAFADVADCAMFTVVQPLLSLNSLTDLTAVSCLTLMSFSSVSTPLKWYINSFVLLVSNCDQMLPSVWYASSAWVSNPRAARLYYAARGHTCKVGIRYNNYTIMLAVWCTTYCYFPSCVPRTDS